MGYLSWFGRKARTGRALLLFVVLLMAVALSGASVPASAQAAPAHVASSGMALHLVVSRHSPMSSAETTNFSDCIPPAGTICVGPEIDTSTGRCGGPTWADIVNSANHSAWESFRSVVGFNPSCVDDSNSHSAIWTEIESNEGTHCTPISDISFDTFNLPWTIFFIRYNSPCGNEPGGEPS